MQIEHQIGIAGETQQMVAQSLNFADDGQRRQRIPHRRAHLLQIIAARAGRWRTQTGLRQGSQIGEVAVKITPARQIETTYAAAEQHLGQPRRVGHRYENDFAAQFAAPFRLAE